MVSWSEGLIKHSLCLARHLTSSLCRTPLLVGRVYPYSSSSLTGPTPCLCSINKGSSHQLKGTLKPLGDFIKVRLYQITLNLWLLDFAHCRDCPILSLALSQIHSLSLLLYTLL